MGGLKPDFYLAKGECMEGNSGNSERKIINFYPRELEKEGITGELFTGTYNTTYENERVSGEGRKFTSVSHSFDTLDGDRAYVGGSGLLNWIMRNKVKPGDTVTVSYEGKDDMGHKFSVTPVK